MQGLGSGSKVWGVDLSRLGLGASVKTMGREP